MLDAFPVVTIAAVVLGKRTVASNNLNNANI